MLCLRRLNTRASLGFRETISKLFFTDYRNVVFLSQSIGNKRVLVGRILRGRRQKVRERREMKPKILRSFFLNSQLKDLIQLSSFICQFFKRFSSFVNEFNDKKTRVGSFYLHVCTTDVSQAAKYVSLACVCKTANITAFFKE